VRIFLSYPSKHQDLAEQLSLSLVSEGHTVFYDRTALAAGLEFDRQIREEIDRSDLFVFLVSAESVAKGRYTLTELMLARKKWPHPGGHVLPVLIEPTEMSTIPPYLRAVTLLAPEGNLAAEVLAHMAAMPAVRRASNDRSGLPIGAILFAIPAAWLIGQFVTLALVGLGLTPFVVIGTAGGAVCSLLIASFAVSMTGSAAFIRFGQLIRISVCFLLAGLFGGFVGLAIWLFGCAFEGTPVGCRNTSNLLWQLGTGLSSALGLAGASTITVMEFSLARLRQTRRGAG
jgi:TIR domain